MATNNIEHIPNKENSAEQSGSVNPWDELLADTKTKCQEEEDYTDYGSGYVPNYGSVLNKGRAARAVIENDYQGFADDLDM